MTVCFEKHFGMTWGVHYNSEESLDEKWRILTMKTEVEFSTNYTAIKQYEHYLGWGCERIARIALGILCVIATLGFGLLTESVRRCFTGRQVLIVLVPKIVTSENEQLVELLEKKDYRNLSTLPHKQKDRYDFIKDGDLDLLLTLPDWNNKEEVAQWTNSVIEAMKSHYPLKEEKEEEFVVDYEAAAYGYMRDQMDGAFIEDERKSTLVCNLDQFMYENAITRIVNHQRARGLQVTYDETRLRELAQRFYDKCRAQGISNLTSRARIRHDLYEFERSQGLAK